MADEADPLMTTASRGAHFELKVDGIVRTHRDERDTAIEAARLLQQRIPGAKIVITDLRDGSVASFDRSA
jgi:RNase P/RNase MRP subunit POP5